MGDVKLPGSAGLPECIPKPEAANFLAKAMAPTYSTTKCLRSKARVSASPGKGVKP